MNTFTGILNVESAQRATDAEVRVILNKENAVARTCTLYMGSCISDA